MTAEAVDGRDLDDLGILLTGATGLVGGAILKRLLQSTQARIICLVRHDVETALDRLEARTGLRRDVLRASRLRLLPASLDGTPLAIDPKNLTALRQSVDCIIHTASETAFLARGRLMSTNVHGLRSLLDLAALLPRLRRIIHLGTAASAGTKSDAEISEIPCPTDPDRHLVPYTYSKALAEKMLFSSPVGDRTISIRPSYIIPDLALTRHVAMQTAFPLLLMHQLPSLPLRSDTQVDLVNLSLVVEACLLMLVRQTEHSVYHASSGHAGSPRWAAVIDALAEQSGRPGPVFRPMAEGQLHIDAGKRTVLGRAAPYIRFISQNLTYSPARLFQEFPQLRRFGTSPMPAIRNVLKHCDERAALSYALSDC